MWLLGFIFGPHLCKPLIWLQAQSQGCDVKVLQIFHFELTINPQSLKQMIFLLKIIGMILKFNTYY